MGTGAERLPRNPGLGGALRRDCQDHRERVYDRRVFFIRDIGFIEPTDARRITFEDSVEFERVHAQTYPALGYELVNVPRAEVADRTGMIEAFVASWN